MAGNPLPVSVPCPTCGASTSATVAWVRTCGAVSCDRCAELIFVNGEQLASDIAAIDKAMCYLDEVISELTKPLVLSAAVAGPQPNRVAVLQSQDAEAIVLAVNPAVSLGERRLARDDEAGR